MKVLLVERDDALAKVIVDALGADVEVSRTTSVSSAETILRGGDLHFDVVLLSRTGSNCIGRDLLKAAAHVHHRDTPVVSYRDKNDPALLNVLTVLGAHDEVERTGNIMSVATSLARVAIVCGCPNRREKMASGLQSRIEAIKAGYRS